MTIEQVVYTFIGMALLHTLRALGDKLRQVVGDKQFTHTASPSGAPNLIVICCCACSAKLANHQDLAREKKSLN